MHARKSRVHIDVCTRAPHKPLTNMYIYVLLETSQSRGFYKRAKNSSRSYNSSKHLEKRGNECLTLC